MMRRALIIGAPDDSIPGVMKDMASYRNFLLSPLGGAWTSDEIVTLTSPTKASVQTHVDALSDAEYSFTVFAGHGRHLVPSNATIIQIQPNIEMDSSELRQGAEKHTLILDCCRLSSLRKLTEDRMFAKADQRGLTLNATECRRYFDQQISESAKGLVVLFSCSVDETAGESEERGGYYSSSLILAAEEWKRGSKTDLSKEYAIFSVLKAHEAATLRVKGLSGNRQNPTVEHPRVEKFFPFAVIA